MKKTLLTLTAMATVALSGCATQSISSFQSFQANDLNRLISSGHLKQTQNVFYVINDSSSSMSDTYVGAGFSGLTKLSVEKEILNRMNQTIPNISLSSGLRSFGYGSCMDWGYTKLNQAMQSYSSSSFDGAINSLACSGGGTPVAAAFEAANADLASTSGNISVILLSDGHNYDISPIPAIEALKATHGDKLCVHTIWVGNDNQQEGQATLKQLSEASGCGTSTTASAIASSSGMSDFVTAAFFNRTTPAPVKVRAVAPVQNNDSDNDGVNNNADNCPNTPSGAIVDTQGCWAFRGLLFDTNKASIKPGNEALFDNAILVLKQNSGLTVEIQGHTDSTGSKSYNQRLSEKRALSVKRLLVNNGISASRLTTRGFGESSPVASNDTREGRAFNRRVAYTRTDM